MVSTHIGHLTATETEKSLVLQSEMKLIASQDAWLTGLSGGLSMYHTGRRTELKLPTPTVT